MSRSGAAHARRAAWLLPTAAFALPLGAALAAGLAQAIDAPAWTRLFADSQTAPALVLSLWVGGASTALALALTLWLVTHLHARAAWRVLEHALGPLLALPHAAFAIGFALLLMPSGWPARLLAPLAGWQAPPDVATVQDPGGLALIAALVMKELPFLLWCVVAQLHRAGQRRELAHQLQTAAAMGYAPASAWWRVLWPQLLPRLALPLLAVWGYGLTVVDMALVVGPTRPPTLGMLAWQWLLDADVQRNRQGAAAAVLLTALAAAGGVLAMLAWRALRPALQRRWSRGDRQPVRGSARGTRGLPVAVLVAAVYVAVSVLLAAFSLAGAWPFPDLAPERWSIGAWRLVARSADTLATTALLALASAATGLMLAVAWMETTPAHWDARAAPALFAPLLLPGVLLAAGLYRAALAVRLDGQFAGLWLAHSLFTTPYALIALAPAYRAFDARYAQTAQALGRSSAAFLWRIKWPMLLAPLAAAFAVGFAVSVTQYLPTQFVGAGRHATLTTEALTLAAGGQRTLAAAFGLAQALLPALVFALALGLARRQQRRLGDAAVRV